MLNLLLTGQFAVFTVMLIAIVISLTFHEFGHALVAKLYGDNTAQKAGRLTLNPAAHIDPMGLVMVAIIGFGYAKPVPTNPRNFKSLWGEMFVAAAGPAMNLLVAIFAVNFYLYGLVNGWAFVQGEGPRTFFVFLALINLVLMVFNLIPIGSLDGHYILPYFLPKRMAQSYRMWNQSYGNLLLLGLMVLSMVGVPVFNYIQQIGQSLLPLITFVSIR